MTDISSTARKSARVPAGDGGLTVDVKSLHAALDAARAERGLSWRQLAKELDVSASTISRMTSGLKPDVTAFASMTTWLGIAADQFFVSGQRAAVEPDLVASLAPLLRARSDLNEADVAYLQDLIGAAARRIKAERHPAAVPGGRSGAAPGTRPRR